MNPSNISIIPPLNLFIPFSISLQRMTFSSIRQPGDVVNEVFSQNIEAIIQLCLEAGDDPSQLIEETKHELQVNTRRNSTLSLKSFLCRKWLQK